MQPQPQPPQPGAHKRKEEASRPEQEEVYISPPKTALQLFWLSRYNTLTRALCALRGGAVPSFSDRLKVCGRARGAG